MPPEPSSLPRERRALRALARHHGVQAAFETQDQRRAVIGDESLVGVLAALGVPIGGRTAGARTAGRRRGQSTACSNQSWCAGQARSTCTSLTLPAAVTPGGVHVTVRHEDGSVEHRPLRSLLVGRADAERIDGTSVLRHRFRLDRPARRLPGLPPSGGGGPWPHRVGTGDLRPAPLPESRPGLGRLRPPPRRADRVRLGSGELLAAGRARGLGRWARRQLRRHVAPLRLLPRRAGGGAQPIPAGQPAGMERALRRRRASPRARPVPRGPPVARLDGLPPTLGPPASRPTVRSPRHAGGQARGPRAARRRPGRILVHPPRRPGGLPGRAARGGGVRPLPRRHGDPRSTMDPVEGGSAGTDPGRFAR